MSMTDQEREEVLALAAQAFTKANKRSRNDQGRGDPALGAILAVYLEGHGYSQAEFGREIGRHPTFVNKVINGERGVSIETLANMTYILGQDFSRDYLMTLHSLSHAAD